MWGGYCPGSSRPHTPPTGLRKERQAFPASPFLEIYPHHPDLCPRVQDQNECSKPTKFDELTLALLLDTIDVFLAEVKNAAPIDSRSKLERTSLLRFVSLLNWYGSKLTWYIFYQHKKITVCLNQRVSQTVLCKARLPFSLAFSSLRWRFSCFCRYT